MKKNISPQLSIRTNKIAAFLFCLGFITNGFCQSDVKFYNIIQEDSVRLYFNVEMEYTSEMCADYARSIRLNLASQFNGDFKDVSSKNRLLGKGRYIHGIKNGKFQINHLNGKIQCRGMYLNNQPKGRWEYFHKNGKPERTIIFTNSDTLLVSLFSPEGDTLVSKGQGYFIGYVSGTPSGKDDLFAKGKITDGKPDSIWHANLNGERFCTEYYNKGKRIKTIKEYRQEPAQINRMLLYSFHRKNYLNRLEEFVIQDCYESLKLKAEQYKFDSYQFTSVVQKNMEYIVSNDFKSGRINNYTIGYNYMIVKFLINSEGKPYDIKLVSRWGQQFFYIIRKKLFSNIDFPPNTGPFYFLLKMNYTGGDVFSYSIGISRTKPDEY